MFKRSRQAKELLEHTMRLTRSEVTALKKGDRREGGKVREQNVSIEGAKSLNSE